MNYLSHSFLSNNDSGLLVGNFIADHISGNNFEHYPKKIIEGIRLHRKIDEFTDSHPKFKESKRFFYPDFEKYSGILVDIYFDYLLASNFEVYSKTPLKDYCDKVYRVYLDHLANLPKGSASFLNYVIKNNIYFAYSSIPEIEKVLFDLSHRINHGVWLNDSLKVFSENKEQLKKNFDFFFNDAVKQFL